jgi:hypothetical protein
VKNKKITIAFIYCILLILFIETISLIGTLTILRVKTKPPTQYHIKHIQINSTQKPLYKDFFTNSITSGDI